MLGFRNWGNFGDLGFLTNHIVIKFFSYSIYSSLDFRKDNQHHLHIHKAYTHRYLVISSSRILYSVFRKRVSVSSIYYKVLQKFQSPTYLTTLRRQTLFSKSDNIICSSHLNSNINYGWLTN